MSDLRETIAKALFKSDWPNCDWILCDHRDLYRNNADAVLAVITAHMTVTDDDARLLLVMFYGTSDPPKYAVDAMKVALEAFVARKLKAETP